MSVHNYEEDIIKKINRLVKAQSYNQPNKEDKEQGERGVV